MVKTSAWETDPVLLEVIRNRLTACANEMALALQRTAYSTNIKTRLDFSCALFDPQVRALAQSFSQPHHLGSLPHFVPRILSEYGMERLRPGDAIICNDAYRGGVHLNDVCVVAPVFFGDKLVAFAATIAHHLDVGGATPGSIGLATEVTQEGLRIPPIRLMNAGELDPNVFRLLENNVRSARETAGDLRAQIAGVSLGIRRYNEVIAKYGTETLGTAASELLDYTERRTRASLTRIPAGTYEGEGYMDGDGVRDEPFKVVVRITVTEDHVTFDLTGSAPQRRGAVNATYAMTLSNCTYALRVLLDPDLPVNDGFYRVCTVNAPEGTVVNPRYPAPVGGGWETATRVCETALHAFGKAMPERVAAGSKGCLVNLAFGGISPRSERYYVFYETVGGGYGGRAAKDGIDGVQAHGQNTENSPIEETEANYPVQIRRYELIPDSDGAGRHRGGLGIRRDYAFDHEATFSIFSERAKFPPWPLDGGQPARCSHYVLNPETDPRNLPSKVTVQIRPGDVLSVQTAGGGGHGPVAERNPALVLADVRSGKISPERALAVYGVNAEEGNRVD